MSRPSRRALFAFAATGVAATVAAACSHTNDTGGQNGSLAPAPVAVASSAPPGSAGAVVAPAPSIPGEPPPPSPSAARVTIAPVAGITINRPGPVALPPPPLHAAAAMPTLPKLPAPASYRRVTKPSGEDFKGCGQVWTGTEWVPVACVTPKLGAQHGAEVVVPYDKMKPPIDQLPALVDHRADGTEGPVRHQAGPECTTFAFTSGLDHAWARWTGTPGAFSVMQIWGRYHKKQEVAAAAYNIGDVVSSEALWPYDAKLANGWKYCHGDEKPGNLCNQPVDEAKLKEIDKSAIGIITKAEIVPLDELSVLREKLAAGADVAVALQLPSFATAGEPGSRYLVALNAKDPTKAKGPEHVVLLVGYAVTPTGTYYLVHNSFGIKWGDEGYAWLNEEHLRTYWATGYGVVPYVEPIQIARERSDAQRGLSRACGGDQVPDSISGLCAPRCADGSPRHNDICAKAGECPKGMANLTGTCLLAAPTGSGSDPASGVRWSCGPGGCAYSMTKGSQNCAEQECAVSCPAPDFRLATTARGFVCVE